MRSLDGYLNSIWYGETGGAWLRPLGALYGGIMRLRRSAYERGWRRDYRAPCPVIVVGNYTAGGAGKTPLVIELCRRLRALGCQPGIISRGYGGTATAHKALSVDAASDASVVGDEPLLMARRTGSPVAVCPDRRKAIECVLASGVDLIVADGDKAVPPKTSIDAAKLIPNARLHRVSDLGHLAHEEDPDQITALILHCLQAA